MVNKHCHALLCVYTLTVMRAVKRFHHAADSSRDPRSAAPPFLDAVAPSASPTARTIRRGSADGISPPPSSLDRPSGSPLRFATSLSSHVRFIEEVRLVLAVSRERARLRGKGAKPPSSVPHSLLVTPRRTSLKSRKGNRIDAQSSASRSPSFRASRIRA